MLVPAVTVPPAAAADATPAESDADTGTLGPTVVSHKDRSSLNAVSCLLAVLAAASNGSMYLGAVNPWHGSLGCEVLKLLEQYIRTALSHLASSFDAQSAGNGSGLQPRHRQPAEQHAGEWAETCSIPTIHAGVHAWIYNHSCSCCIDKPECLDAGLHRQLATILPQLFQYKKDSCTPKSHHRA